MVKMKEGFYHLLKSKVAELNARGWKFVLGDLRLDHGKMIISLTGDVTIGFIIETEGDNFYLCESGVKILFSKDDLINHLLALTGDKVYPLLLKKVVLLKTRGRKFILTPPVFKKKGVVVSVKGQSLVKFRVCHKEEDIFHLRDESGGEEMCFILDDLVEFILGKANGGPVFGFKPERHFEHLEAIPVT